MKITYNTYFGIFVVAEVAVGLLMCFVGVVSLVYFGVVDLWLDVLVALVSVATVCILLGSNYFQTNSKATLILLLAGSLMLCCVSTAFPTIATAHYMGPNRKAETFMLLFEFIEATAIVLCFLSFSKSNLR